MPPISRSRAEFHVRRSSQRNWMPPRTSRLPERRRSNPLAEQLGIDAAATSKAMPVVANGDVVLSLVRGDDRLDEAKLAAILGTAVRPATTDEIKETFGADPGSIGPVGVGIQVIADEALREGQFVAGANQSGRHLRGVEAGRDYEPRFADIREAKEGDSCPKCGGRLRFQTAIEVGHIFKLGTYYSQPLGATFLDETGTERPIVMGSYGIGPGRIMAAAVEQNHDEHGIAWPRSLAPYDAEIVPIETAGLGAMEIAERLADDLEEAGNDVLVDDRDRRPGEKFADADLIGCPVRITVGKKALEDGKVDFVQRAGRVEDRLTVEEVVRRVGEGA